MTTQREKNFKKFVKFIVADLNKRPQTKSLTKKQKEQVAREIWKELNHTSQLAHDKPKRKQKGKGLTNEERQDLDEEYIKQRNENIKTQKYVNWLQMAMYGYNAAKLLGSIGGPLVSSLL